VAKPDLIELSTDWKTALLVADRYTGVGGGSDTNAYFAERAKTVLASVLLIANKQAKGYGWVASVLADGDDKQLLEITEGRNDALGLPFQHLRDILPADYRQSSSIVSTAYLMLSKALQPRSVLDPSIDEAS
jgi:hypothetical protein